MTNHQKSYAISMEISIETLLSDEILAEMRAHGMRYLAIPPAFYDLDDDTIRQRGRRLTNMGFMIDTCHPPYGGGNKKNSICAEVEETRLESIAMWKHYLQRFSLTGMRAVPLHTGGAMHPAGSRQAMERLTDSIGQILPVARKSNVIIALENTFFQNPCPFSDAPNPSGVSERFINDDCVMLADYVRRWNDPCIKVCHDVGHSNILGHSVRKDLETLAPLTVLYHVHDNDGVNDCHFNVGEGALPWHDVIEALDKSNFAYPLYDEVLGEPDPILKPLLKSPERVIAHFEQAREVFSSR